jgi:hypothetical protein
MSSKYQPFQSLPPRKLLLHHRLILLASGVLSQMGWVFVAMGCFFVALFSAVFIVAEEGALAESWSVLFTLIFPIVGGIMVAYSLKRNFKAVDLITNGKFARGKIIEKRPTNTKINEQTVYEFTIEFVADNGRTYQVKSRTHHLPLLTDEEEELVLYAPADPSLGVIFDAIPNAPKFVGNGEIAPPRIMQYFNLILPALGLSMFLLMLTTLFSISKIVFA